MRPIPNRILFPIALIALLLLLAAGCSNPAIHQLGELRLQSRSQYYWKTGYLNSIDLKRTSARKVLMDVLKDGNLLLQLNKDKPRIEKKYPYKDIPQIEKKLPFQQPGGGNLIWAKRAGGTSNDTETGYAITTLSDNSTVVSGVFYGSATFGPGEQNHTVLNSAGGGDIFIARYNPDGALTWAKRAGGIAIDEGYGITALSDNSTVVTGAFADSATFGAGEPNQTVLTSAGSRDIFIARYDPNGTLAWAKRAGGTSSEESYRIMAISDDSTVVIGHFQGSGEIGPEATFRPGSATFGPGEPNQTVLTGRGIFIACYNPNGTLAWAKRAGGASGWDWSVGITTLSDNSTVVTGGFGESAPFKPGEPNQIALTSAGGNDIFIARYNPNGTLAWAKRAGGTNDESGVGITTLSDNSTVVTGYFWGSATFGPGEPNQTVLNSAGGRDIFIARFAP